MPEYSGSLQSFELAFGLWWAPLLPLAAALYSTFAGDKLSRGPSPGTERPLPPAEQVSLVGVLAAFGIVAFNAVVLAALPAGRRVLVSHGWQMLRVGSLDATYTLALDGATALVALAIVGASACALLWIRGGASARRDAVGIDLAVAGVLLALLGDDWVVMVLGVGLSGAGAHLLASQARTPGALRAFLLGRAGDAVLLGAGAVVLWGLSGGWTSSGEHIPDFRARLVGVQLGSDAEVPKRDDRGRLPKDAVAHLTMGALPGASLEIGGADLCALDTDGKPGGVGVSGRPCRVVATTPFSRLPVSVALHDIRVHAGHGTLDLLVEKVRLSPGQETILTPSAGTLVLREHRELLALRDATGAFPVRAEVLRRRLFGSTVIGWVTGLLALSLLLRLLAVPFALGATPGSTPRPAVSAVVAATELTLGVALLLRTGFWFELAPVTTAALGVAVALAALAAAVRSLRGLQVSEVVAAAVAAQAAALAIGLGAGAGRPALAVGLGVLGLGAPALLLAIGSAARSRGERAALDVRQLGGLAQSAPAQAKVAWGATLALAGAPFPLLGLYWPKTVVLEAATGADALGRLWAFAAAGLGIVASALAAHGLWRVYFLVFQGAPAGPGSRGSAATDEMAAERAGRRLLPLLALVALALGAVAIPGAYLRTSAPSLLDGWLAVPPLLDAPGLADRAVRWALMGVGFAAALAGWASARSRYLVGRTAKWPERDEADLGARVAVALSRVGAGSDAGFGKALSAAARRLSDVDLAFERAIVGPAPEDELPEAVASEPAPEPAAEPESEAETESEAPDASPKRKKAKRRGKRP